MYKPRLAEGGDGVGYGRPKTAGRGVKANKLKGWGQENRKNGGDRKGRTAKAKGREERQGRELRE